VHSGALKILVRILGSPLDLGEEAIYIVSYGGCQIFFFGYVYKRREWGEFGVDPKGGEIPLTNERKGKKLGRKWGRGRGIEISLTIGGGFMELGFLRAEFPFLEKRGINIRW